jgi:hypothetical protein
LQEDGKLSNSAVTIMLTVYEIFPVVSPNCFFFALVGDGSDGKPKRFKKTVGC